MMLDVNIIIFSLRERNHLVTKTSQSREGSVKTVYAQYLKIVKLQCDIINWILQYKKAISWNRENTNKVWSLVNSIVLIFVS